MPGCWWCPVFSANARLSALMTAGIGVLGGGIEPTVAYLSLSEGSSLCGLKSVKHIHFVLSFCVLNMTFDTVNIVSDINRG